ncbi:Catabolic 3-dehydroquinase [Dirofilaria immitis]
MVHSPKHISHITNIKLEPYSVVTDISTADTDYASITSNDSFYNNPYLINGQPVFGPWPKHILPTKSHSESDHLHQFIRNDIKQNSSVTVTDTAVHYGNPSAEVNVAPIKIPITGKYGIDGQDERESENSVQMIASILSPKKQNKLHFEQLQQRLVSLATPIVNLLGTKIETTGESSTDQDLEINKIDNIKLKVMETTPTVTLQSTPKSIKSDEIHDSMNKIDDKSSMHNSRYKQRKYTVDLPTTTFVPSMTTKMQKMMNATYRTAISQKDICLKSNPEDDFFREKYTNELMLGIGKILRRGDGGIAALYKNALERPNSRLSKILYSIL